MVSDEQLAADAGMREVGRYALQIYRGAREDGSRDEAFWATVACILAILTQKEE